MIGHKRNFFKNFFVFPFMFFLLIFILLFCFYLIDYTIVTSFFESCKPRSLFIRAKIGEMKYYFDMKNLYRFFVFALVASFSFVVLSGCGGTETPDEISAGPGEKLYSASDFSIVYPQDWELLERHTFTSLVPHQTVVAFRNNIQNEVFTANVNVSRAQIDGEIDAEDFAKSTMAKIRTTLLDVREFPMERYGSGVVFEFRGRKSPAEPLVHFNNLSVVYGSSAYIVTGAYLPSEESSVVNYVDRMLKSFSLE